MSKIDPKYDVFPIKTRFVVFCGGCDMYYLIDTPKEAIEMLNEHLESEHCGDRDAYTDSALYPIGQQIQLGLEESLRLTLPAPILKKGKK